MNLFKNRFIAHRGLHKSIIIPENSIQAFKNAMGKNYAIEFDINITIDNQIVIFHDDDLNRLCNKKEKIEIIDYSELTKREEEIVERYFQEIIFPIVTPMAIDSSRRFPHLSNKSFNLII